MIDGLKMRMKSLSLLVLLVLLLSLLLSLLTLLHTPVAHACSRGPTTQEADYLAANAIFSAAVTRVEAVYPSHKMAVVEPLDVYKGKASSYVLTNEDSDQCGVALEEGRTYLFLTQGWDMPYVSVFDTYAEGDERTKALVQWLKERSAAEPSDLEDKEVYRLGEIGLMLEQQDKGKIERAFISNHSVYAPLTVANGILGVGGMPASVGKQLEAKMVAYNNERYVPLRLAAETLGYEVGWDPNNTMVVIRTPFEKQKGSLTLAMHYLTNVGLEGSLEVDRLTDDEITYRKYHGHMPPGMDVQPQTHPFADMLQEEIGYRKYMLEFYVAMEPNDIRLLAAPELIHKIETDSAFRKIVGDRLGKPIGEMPAHRLLTVADFE